MQSTTLYYREGSSDKIYQVAVEQKGSLFVVNFAYGRRGSTLTTGTKTAEPVDEEMAAKIFNRLVNEKKAKGYTEGENGTPYQHSEQQHTGIHCQLLNPIEEEELEGFIEDNDWCAQQKFDGKRLLIRKRGKTIIGINRRGLEVGLPLPLIEAFTLVDSDFILDGEAVGDVYYAFDILSFNGDLSDITYRERLDFLRHMTASIQPSAIHSVWTALDEASKRTLLRELRQVKAEGIVFKLLDAPYTPGRPNSGGSQFKHKFYATATAVVEKLNDKRSALLKLWNGTAWVVAGNVTIPSKYPLPQPGQTVEIRYLYAFLESGCLYQPVYLGFRDDVEEKDCTVSQLKFKGKEDEC